MSSTAAVIPHERALRARLNEGMWILLEPDATSGPRRTIRPLHVGPLKSLDGTGSWIYTFTAEDIFGHLYNLEVRGYQEVRSHDEELMLGGEAEITGTTTFSCTLNKYSHPLVVQSA